VKVLMLYFPINILGLLSGLAKGVGLTPVRKSGETAILMGGISFNNCSGFPLNSHQPT